MAAHFFGKRSINCDRMLRQVIYLFKFRNILDNFFMLVILHKFKLIQNIYNITSFTDISLSVVHQRNSTAILRSVPTKPWVNKMTAWITRDHKENGPLQISLFDYLSMESLRIWRFIF